MFHRILVGVDDSAAAQAALREAVELVEAGHGRLGLLSAAPRAMVPAAGPVMLPVNRDQLDRELVEWACRNVEEAAKLVPQEIPVTKLVKRGSPWRAMLNEARSGTWDLLIVGQSARRFHLPARVGEWLTHFSPTPVLVVHEDGSPPRRRRTRRRTQVRTA
jgi:nucleotide-binding universal stress UspA family protein